MRMIHVVALLWASLAGAAFADTPEQGIIVTGEGRISAPPDMATITLGVSETGETAKAAMDTVSSAVAGILAELDTLDIAAVDRQTSGFYLHPVHNDRDREGDGTPRITGYRAGNSVTVQVRDLTRLGETLDSVIEIGVNEFNGLSFGLTDDSGALEAARALAVGDAQLRATQLAEAAGLSLGAVLRLTEVSHQGRPVMMEMARSAGAMQDSIATGEVDVVAQVTMVFAIAPGGQ